MLARCGYEPSYRNEETAFWRSDLPKTAQGAAFQTYLPLPRTSQLSTRTVGTARTGAPSLEVSCAPTTHVGKAAQN